MTTFAILFPVDESKFRTAKSIAVPTKDLYNFLNDKNSESQTCPVFVCRRGAQYISTVTWLPSYPGTIQVGKLSRTKTGNYFKISVESLDEIVETPEIEIPLIHALLALGGVK